MNFIVFYLGLWSIMYVFWRLVSGFVGDENDLHRVYTIVNYNKLNLYEVGNNLVRFLSRLLQTLLVFRAFD